MIPGVDTYQIHNSMRGIFAFELYKAMLDDERIWLITGGLGYKMFDPHREDIPERFIDCGAAEMSMMAIAIGLAMQGKIPVVYSITPFLLKRPYELIDLYVDFEEIPVKLVGSGRDYDYKHDGQSHHAYDTEGLLLSFPRIYSYWPEIKEEIPGLMNDFLYNKRASFLSLRR